MLQAAAPASTVLAKGGPRIFSSEARIRRRGSPACTARRTAQRRNRHGTSKEPAFPASNGSVSTAGDDPGPPPDAGAGSPASPGRKAVLQACTGTSAALLALGIAVREASHAASVRGWPVLDSTEISFGFETWHLGLIAGLVAAVSSARYILLNTWGDFRESSEAANRQILSPLEPVDYIAVALLPGISEELLFRGALMPQIGLSWAGAIVTGAVFGVLHLGGGRKKSFAIWATAVGIAYGIAAVASSSVVVPMASHSINNLIGGLLWRYSTTLPQPEPEEKVDA